MDELVEKVVGGDRSAWQALWQAVEPTVWAVTGRFQITGPLSERDDDRRNIVLEVMHRLHAGGYRRLRAYLAAAKERPDQTSFKGWVTTVAVRTAIDYVRRHPEYHDLRKRDAGPRWVRLTPVADGTPARHSLDPSRLATATLMLERAQGQLRRDQLLALGFWLQGSDHEAIAAQLELTDRVAAQRLVRSALKRLRDRYRAAHVSAQACCPDEELPS